MLRTARMAAIGVLPLTAGATAQTTSRVESEVKAPASKLTELQVRERIDKQGYTAVTGLKQTAPASGMGRPRRTARRSTSCSTRTATSSRSADEAASHVRPAAPCRWPHVAYFDPRSLRPSVAASGAAPLPLEPCAAPVAARRQFERIAQLARRKVLRLLGVADHGCHAERTRAWRPHSSGTRPRSPLRAAFLPACGPQT